MGIELNGDFSQKFEELKQSELEKAGKKGEFEVGVYFEKNMLSSLSFNQLSGPWTDHYWILFPNPEKTSWNDVKKALQAGIKYLLESSSLTRKELGIMD